MLLLHVILNCINSKTGQVVIVGRQEGGQKGGNLSWVCIYAHLRGEAREISQPLCTFFQHPSSLKGLGASQLKPEVMQKGGLNPMGVERNLSCNSPEASFSQPKAVIRTLCTAKDLALPERSQSTLQTLDLIHSPYLRPDPKTIQVHGNTSITTAGFRPGPYRSQYPAELSKSVRLSMRVRRAGLTQKPPQYTGGMALS